MRALSIFMIVLTFITGFDLCNDQEVYRNETAVENTEPGTDKHQDEAPCTPFCNCARCPFSVMLPSQGIEFHVLTIPVEKFSTYLGLKPLQIISSIWQPPKLV
jgi:hypothetical protein